MEGGQEVSEIQPNRTLWRGIFSFLFFERQQRSHLKHHIASYKENNTGKATLLYINAKIYINKHTWEDILKHVGLLRVTGQNGSGQNGMDKMVYGQNGVEQNGMDKMVAIFGIDYNSSEFNSYLITK